MDKKRKNLKPYLIASAITLVIGGGLFCLFYFLVRKGSIVDGLGYPAIILLSIGGLMFVSSCGFFDFLSYGVKQFGSLLFGRKPNNYNDYPGYRQYKADVRKKSPSYFGVVLIIGAIFFIATIIVLLVFKSR